MKKLKLSLGLIAFMGVTNCAMAQTIIDQGNCGAQGNNLTWVLTSDSVLVIYGKGDMEDYDQTLYRPWDSYRNSIATLLIGDSVTTVGLRAFVSCSNLVSVIIGNNVTTIKLFAFADCTSLTSVSIPNNVIDIEGQIFLKCSNLTSIDVDNDNTYYSSENGVLFNKSKTILIKYPEGKTNENYIIPNSVITIGDYAFYQCYRLTSVTIPNSVTIIGGYAFENCTGLVSVIIPNNVMTLEYCVFANCNGLVSVTVQWTEPLIAPYGLFRDVITKNVKLYVPQGTAKAYRSADVWKDFQIDEYEVGIANTTQMVSNIKIYPNPTTGQLTISPAGGGKGVEELTIEKIEIYNVMGQLLYQINKSTNKQINKEFSIDVSHLSAGMYFLKIENKVVKFVKE